MPPYDEYDMMNWLPRYSIYVLVWKSKPHYNDCYNHFLINKYINIICITVVFVICIEI